MAARGQRRCSIWAILWATPFMSGCSEDFEPAFDSAVMEDGPATDALFSDAGETADGSPELCTFPCPEPAAGHNSLCGRIRRVDTGEPLEVDGGGIGVSCTSIPEAERTGPCLLSLELYDALAFAQNPTGATPLGSDEVSVYDCGYYSAANVPTPALGFLAVAADDQNDDGGIWELSSTSRPVAAEERLVGLDVFVVLESVDEAWTVTAGNPWGAGTFAEKGVLLAVYSHGEQRSQGVQITRDPAGVVAADDYYFDDTSPSLLTSVNPGQSATGPNGGGLIVNSPLVDHSGQGGALPTGCQWPKMLGKSVPGVVWVSTYRAELTSSGELCP